MNETLTVTRPIHFTMKNKGKRAIMPGPAPVDDTPDGRIPRLSRLMALAIHFENLIQSGGVRDQAELAQLGHVTRARMTQIMNLLLLAPDIQEQILYLPLVTNGRDPLTERDIRPMLQMVDWQKQRIAWKNRNTLKINN
jgi:hypothetical protein